MWEQTRHDISRRRLLRGLGAATALLAPFVRNRLVDAATGGNFLFFFTPNGHVRSDFGATAGTNGNYTLLPSLAPLESHKSDLIVIRGLNNKTSSYFNSHEDAQKTMSMYFGGGDANTNYGPSFDQELSAALGGGPALTLGVEPLSIYENVYTALSWVAPGKSSGKITNAVKAYTSVFGAGVMPAGSSGNDAAAADLLARRKSVLDFVQSDVARFSSRLVGKDKENLDLYLTSIRSLETKLGSNPDLKPQVSCDGATLQKQAAAAPGVSGTVDRYKANHDVMIDIIATAFACGVRRASSLCNGAGLNVVRGTDPNHHAVSHGEAPVSEWKAIDRWYAERFAYIVAKLKSLGVLDDTVVVWGSDISENHNQCDQVMVLAGGRKKGIQVGKGIIYPYFGKPDPLQRDAHAAAIDPRNASQADLYVSIQKAFGVNKDYVGDKQWCTGGLKEVFPG
jgi:hypothetical protein